VWRDWEQAWQQALYDPGGFVDTGSPPSAHFRTSVHVGSVLAEAVAELVGRVDTALGHPAELDVVDLGAGGGELLTGVCAAVPVGLRARMRPLAVDLRPAPSGWSSGWAAVLPARVRGLLVAHEWLDALACPVVMHDGVTVRRVQVTDDGRQRLGPAAGGAVLAWLQRWSPLRAGMRVEVGLPRDVSWAGVLRSVVTGAAVAVDYGGMQAGDTLAAYRRGRQVRCAPDGHCDLTAHVFWPSVQALAPAVLRTQAQVLADLGAYPGGTDRRPPTADPWQWLLGTVRAGHLAELCDPAGLGGFGWLVAGCGGVRPTDLGVTAIR